MRFLGRDRSNAWRWALGLSLVLALVVGVASAGKPAKPPPEPDTGSIYYGFGGSLWVMDTDGSNKTELSHLSGVPSEELHNGKRWFLEEREIDGGGKYPDGRKVRELFAYNESKDITVQLTDNPLREIHKWHHSRWTPGDQAICWGAHTWVWDELAEAYVVDEAGLYYLVLEYDSDGNIVEPSPGNEPLVAVYGGYIVDDYGVVVPDLYHCAWSPDHTRVAHIGPGGIWVTDVNTHEGYCLTGTTGAGGMEWSAADVIGFAGDGGICIINPDGTGKTQLLSARHDTSLTRPRFAPDGIQFVYEMISVQGGDMTVKIFKSSILKPLAKNLGTEGSVIQWR